MRFIAIIFLMGLTFASYADDTTHERKKICPAGWHMTEECLKKYEGICNGVLNCPCEKINPDSHQKPTT